MDCAAATLTTAALVASVPNPSLRCTPFADRSFGATCDASIPSLLAEMDALNTSLRTQLNDAFDRHSVLVFQNQSLTPAEQVAFVKLLPWDSEAPAEHLSILGNPGLDAERWNRWKVPEQPEVLLQGEGEVIDHHGLSGNLSSGKPILEFHTDGVYELERPPVVTSLYSVSIKPAGGDTLFVSSADIYQALPDELRARADGLRAVYRRVPRPMHHSGLRARIDADGDGAGSASLGQLYDGSASMAAETSTTHPLVWVHPSTGARGVVVAPMWLSHLEERDGTPLGADESQLLVEQILRGGGEPYAHKWRVGDFVIWDNRATLHSATPNDGFSAEGLRLLERIRMSGAEKPQGPPLE